MTATHWTVECQRRWDKLVKDTFQHGPFPPHVLGLGSLSMGLLSQSATPWQGEFGTSDTLLMVPISLVILTLVMKLQVLVDRLTRTHCSSQC